ncbi:alpha-glucosidase [Romeria aff. gracilis LEGE 07310]|uniref:Alpha-glucosidase n=1 Tax=Vasconcelosia minhoensis LEGE 07310 TaxID=915328 RepID=A0A8J7AYU0_9CYAN|nr:TIM-barrel domain-containing protein [Romeria gracilis]MBE9080403.1 alpha-glucosidase [Romeria aff. gracilis LEGE 07310]
MPSSIFSADDAYKFIKVEDYFSRYKEWEKLETVASYTFDPDSETFALNFKKSNGDTCSALIQFVQKDTFRFRFNPNNKPADYTQSNTSSIIMDDFESIKKHLETKNDFKVTATETSDGIEIITRGGPEEDPSLKMVITFSPFNIEVFNVSEAEVFKVWQTASPGIYYTANGPEDHAIIQAVNKPATAKYIGFGEQGGHGLEKNTAQLNYFNFDNMRYRQVYDQGPLDSREPLYHSDPFFFEFNGVPSKKSVNAVFVDNPGQVLVDVGYLNSSRYMFGTRFGDLDYYFFLNGEPAHVLRDFTSIVGRPRLKPRYILGYHQGCYGYDSRDKLEWAVQKHREYQIPLDGLHVDVDVQHEYQTFTVDTQKFPDPFSMFHNLRDQGIKCSTNITPVISNKDPNYQTYKEGLEHGYFVADNRYEPDNPASKSYQCYGSGNEYRPNNPDAIEGFNSGQPFTGGVYYGNDDSGNELGTPGHYADLGRKEVRKWWGDQYKYLFDMGLEMVWQDMTTPAIRENCGDMKGFPFRLYVTDDFLSDQEAKLTPAIKVWNLYSYNLHKATYEGLNRLEGRENRRNFIVGRGSFTGSHRFAGLWTGDNASDWDFLQMNVAQVLSLGMCGLAICGQDIGGFETSNEDDGKWASPELLIRWTAVGAFLPWFRNHYVRKGRKEFQEPFMYEQYFRERNLPVPEPKSLYEMVLPICKAYIELRYRLLQLFYDCLFQNSLDGMPICRPMFLNDPADQSLYNDKQAFIENQFFVGKDMLIAPILEPQSETNGGKRDIYLPQDSNWYCFVNNKMPLGSYVEGGTTIRDFDANLNLNGEHINFIIPVYVRSGAIIPMLEVEQYVGQRNAEGKAHPITLNVYPDSDLTGGEYTLYLDDGVSRSSAIKDNVEQGCDELANSEYRQTLITHSYTNSTQRQIDITRVHDGYSPKYEDHFFLAILHDPSETKGSSGCLDKVVVNGQRIAALSDSTELNAAAEESWYYNKSLNTSFIKVIDRKASNMLLLEYFKPNSF